MLRQFVCDLTKCKGGCCEDGDAGAPLEVAELNHLINFYDTIKEYMTAEGIKEIEQKENMYTTENLDG